MNDLFTYIQIEVSFDVRSLRPFKLFNRFDAVFSHRYCDFETKVYIYMIHTYYSREKLKISKITVRIRDGSLVKMY